MGDKPSSTRLVRIDDATRILGRSRSWIYSMAKKGRLPHIRFDETSPLQFDEEELLAFIEKHRRGGDNG